MELHKTGVWYRPDTDDDAVIAEVRREYSGLDCDGQVVLDVGAHIGTVPRLVAPTAARVVCLEPDVGNHAVLAANVAGRSDVERHAVAVAPTSGPLPLYVNNGKGRSMHSAVTVGDKTCTIVDAVALDEALHRWRPTVVKLDVEGIEWLLLDTLADLPDHVTQLGIELHYQVARHVTNGVHPTVVAQLLHDHLTGTSGFGCTREPNLTVDTGTNRTSVANYRR